MYFLPNLMKASPNSQMIYRSKIVTFKDNRQNHKAMKKYLLSLIFSLAIMHSNAQGNQTLLCNTIGSPNASNFNQVGYYIDGTPVEYNGCTVAPSMMVAIIDSCSCVKMDNCNRDFGQINRFFSPDCTMQDATYNCNMRPTFLFQFDLNDPNAVNGMIDLLDSATTCDYILAYTWFTYPYSTLNPAFKNAFISLGANAINSLPDNAPYIFFGKKGDPSSVQELIGNTQQDTLTLNTSFNCATSGINEATAFDRISIYPNPARSGFWINNILPNENITVQLTDPLGKIIYTKIVSGEKEQFINVELSQGVYFVSLIDGTRKAVKKVVIED